MKMVLAVIQPTKLSAVREALAKIGVTRMTVCVLSGAQRSSSTGVPAISASASPSRVSAWTCVLATPAS